MAVWRLGGIGQNFVPEYWLGNHLSMKGIAEAWKEGLQELMALGFLETAQKDGGQSYAVSPLGMAILRQLEEDRLEELR